MKYAKLRELYRLRRLRQRQARPGRLPRD